MKSVPELERETPIKKEKGQKKGVEDKRSAFRKRQ